jgi:hypothetical protein
MPFGIAPLQMRSAIGPFPLLTGWISIRDRHAQTWDRARFTVLRVSAQTPHVVRRTQRADGPGRLSAMPTTTRSACTSNIRPRYRQRARAKSTIFASCIAAGGFIAACSDFDPDFDALSAQDTSLSELHSDPGGTITGDDASTFVESWQTQTATISASDEWPDEGETEGELSSATLDSSQTSSSLSSSDEGETSGNSARLILVEILADPAGKDGESDAPEFLEWIAEGSGPVALKDLDVRVGGWPALTSHTLGIADDWLNPGQTLVVEHYIGPEFLPEPAIARTPAGIRVAFSHHAALRNQGGGIATFASDRHCEDGVIYGDGVGAPPALVELWSGASAIKAPSGYSISRRQIGETSFDADDWVATMPSPGAYEEISDPTETDDTGTEETSSSTSTHTSTSQGDSTSDSSATTAEEDSTSTTQGSSAETTDSSSQLPNQAEFLLHEVLVDPNGGDGSAGAPERVALIATGTKRAAIGSIEVQAGTWTRLRASALGIDTLEVEPDDVVVFERYAKAQDVPSPAIVVEAGQIRVAFSHSGTLRNLGGFVAVYDQVGELRDGMIYGDGQDVPGTLQAAWSDAPLAAPSSGVSWCRELKSPQSVTPSAWSTC